MSQRVTKGRGDKAHFLISWTEGITERAYQEGRLRKKIVIQNKNEFVLSVFLISHKVMYFITNQHPQRYFVHLP